MIRTRALLLAPTLLLAACHEAAPPPATMPAWLQARATQELELAERSGIQHDFRFSDAIVQSGITFVNKPVDDAGRDYKAVHYDHGTGLAVADVDGDGLSDLFFVSQLGTSELWKNIGNGCFSNITVRSGLSMPDAVAVGASFADIDNDGDPDLFVTTVRHGNRLFENLGGGRFRDIAVAAGVGYVGHSSGAVFFDYDRDGLLDLFVTNVGRYTTNQKGRGGYYVGLTDAFLGHTHGDRAEASILYRNLGGNRFRDVSRETGLVDLGWSGDAVPFDANGDGFTDLLALNMQGASHLWINEGGKRFRDRTKEFLPKTSWGAMGVVALDFNGDGKLDVYVTDMHSDMFSDVPAGDWAGEERKSDSQMMPDFLFPAGKSPFIFGNALYAGRAGISAESVSYDEVSDQAGVETYWPWGPSTGDINADGWPDLFVTGGMNYPYRYSVNSVLLNRDGQRFVPSEFTLGVEPRAPLDQPWFQLDCAGADKDHKQCAACADPRVPANACSGDPHGKLTRMSPRASRSSALVDIDNDGDLDVITNEFGAAPQVLISNLSARHKISALKVRLVGTRSNRSGLGAEVTVVLPGGRRMLQVNDGKSGYLSQSDLPLFFGLGSESGASSVEVRWPDGQRQTVAGPFATDRILEITEPR